MLSIRTATGITLLAALIAGSSAIAQGVYTSNPLAEWLIQQAFELRLETQADIQSNKHDRIGLLGGFGWGYSDFISVGIYGSLRGSDRDQPVRWSVLRGIGVFSEYDFAPRAAIAPLAGIRVGILAPTGPRAPTSLHIAGSAGVRAAVSDHVHLVLSGTLNWTEDKLLNYRRTRTGYKADHMDASIDLGLRYRF